MLASKRTVLSVAAAILLVGGTASISTAARFWPSGTPAYRNYNDRNEHGT